MLLRLKVLSNHYSLSYELCWYQIQMSLTSFKGILVKNLSGSRLAMKWSGQKQDTLSANENESRSVNSLDQRDEKKLNKN